LISKFRSWAARNPLKVLNDGVDVPGGHERRERLYDVPGLAHELPKASRCQLALNLCEGVGFC
jgi:hypothetical protein